MSPPDVDQVLPPEFTCWHYSLVQTKADRWDFHYVADHSAPAAVLSALAELIGNDARVVAFRRRHIPPASSGKFALLKPLTE